MVKAILIKPLDGDQEGTEREFDKLDFERLRELGAVRAALDEPKQDAPAEAEAEKKAPAPSNKAAPKPLNKAAPPVADKAES